MNSGLILRTQGQSRFQREAISSAVSKAPELHSRISLILSFVVSKYVDYFCGMSFV